MTPIATVRFQEKGKMYVHEMACSERETPEEVAAEVLEGRPEAVLVSVTIANIEARRLRWFEPVGKA